MGDRVRFKVAAKAISQNFPKVKTILDVAGGRGELQLELNKLGFDTITIDKVSRKKQNCAIQFKNRYFTDGEIDADLYVGLHPDGATETIIDLATKRNKPFFVVPCCIIPHITNFKGDYRQWLKHLSFISKKQNYEIQYLYLSMKGRNIALIGKPTGTN